MLFPNSPAALVFDHLADAFSPAELDSLERYCDALLLAKATLGDDNRRQAGQMRVTRLAEIRPETQIRWFYERMAGTVHVLNRHYGFELTGFHEALQFMVYHDHDGGHFGWHMDVGPRNPRKLSLTLQLTDPSRYEGGDLQFFTGDIVRSAPRERGMLIAFPSFMVHQVTPVTAGTRKSIVAWVSGPQFR
jgi:PKHD-type hydroxylase